MLVKLVLFKSSYYFRKLVLFFIFSIKNIFGVPHKYPLENSKISSKTMECLALAMAVNLEVLF